MGLNCSKLTPGTRSRVSGAQIETRARHFEVRIFRGLLALPVAVAELALPVSVAELARLAGR
ncbi:hypothetical protein Syun_006888 [Stephania yunnanensis]|uniref:Uncharacterized protein n=1 Tax=Stephania yunnanensis TaxID=152371 RepID=A0AAP0KZ63_9MAGN